MARILICLFSTAVLLTSCRDSQQQNPTQKDSSVPISDTSKPDHDSRVGDSTVPPKPGTITISEIMPNPAAVADSAGEWFEIFNASNETANLHGWTIEDAGGKNHTIDAPGGKLNIDPGKYLVLGTSADKGTNGGVPVDYAFGGSFNLANSEDEILLYNTQHELVDKVEYGTVWDIQSGASISLRSADLDNNDAANWCVETSVWPGSSGDKGTPGAGADCGPAVNPDGGVVKDFLPPDLGPPPPPGSIKVAAIQYGPNSYQHAPGCSDNVCGLSYFITQAAQNGAQYVATPEYALDQQYVEWFPPNGSKPATDANWGPSTLIGKMAKLADDLNINLIFNATTQEGSGTTAKLYNTNIVIDPSGKVIASHKKYYLFADEKTSLTSGTNCCDLFNTPAGKAGLLICADINCIVYLDASKSSCTASGLQMMNNYVAAQPYITFFSSYWMAWKATAWKAINVMSKFAQYSNSYMVGANTIDGNYHGGGVFKPDGTAIETVDVTTAGIAYGVIPPANP
ncbi:MAG: lamin tail domain-containing protein [Pseudomonadota bacterium]